MTSLPIPGADGLTELPEPAGTLHDDGCFVFKKRPHAASYAGWKQPFYTAEQVRDAIRAALAAVPAQQMQAVATVSGSMVSWLPGSDKLKVGATLYAEGIAVPAQPAPIQAEVGCERADGLLNIHAENATCEVCAPPQSGSSRPSAAPAGQHDAAPMTDDELDAAIYPPKALLKREDWDVVTRKPKAVEQTRSAACGGFSQENAVVEARPDLASLLKELRDEYQSVIDSAYCQCDSNDDLLARVERLLNGETK